MANKKPKWTPEKVNEARTQWREQHPEAAAERDQKRQATSFEKKPDDENASDPFIVESLSDEQQELAKKKMILLCRKMHDRRHRYLQDRDLNKALLSKQEKEHFREYILHFDGVSGFSEETENLLIEGLKYPDTDKGNIPNFCFQYLDDRYAEGVKPSLMFWMNLWRKSFVPMDAVRLMVSHDPETGTYHPRECFRELWPTIKDNVVKHRDKERKLFNKYLKLSAKKKKLFEEKFKRLGYRVFALETLVGVFEYQN